MALISQLTETWQRRPNVVHWTAVGIVALIAAVLVTGMVGRARTAAGAWGTSVRVLAAQTPLAMGTTPTGDAVAAVDVPAHLVPAGALASPSEVGELARAVPEGGLLTVLDFNAPASVGAGRRGIGVAVAQSAPDVSPGSAVELLLFADIDPFAPDATGSVAERVPARVLEASPERWFVEVDPLHLDAVARASATGIVVPVIVGRGLERDLATRVEFSADQ